jgi:uncharacterized protein (TIGR02270 family)
MPSAPVIVDILEEHFEELQVLWPKRQEAMRSPRYTLRTLDELEERIEAHVQGLLVGGEQTRKLLEPGLVEGDPVIAFIAAYGLLRLEKPEIHEAVLNALVKAEGGGLAGIRDAFCQISLEPILPRMRSILNAPPASSRVEVLAAVAEIFSFHGLDIKTSLMDLFLKHENPKLRQAGWRIAGALPARSPEVIQAGWNDADPAVAGEALLAAVWCRQSTLLTHCRHQLTKPAPPWTAVYLTAVLGKSGECGHLMQLPVEMGPPRYRALGALGHPNVVPQILTAMESKDPVTAVAAGAAFAKITGHEVESAGTALVKPPGGAEPDEFEREFLDEVKLPSAERARAYWEQVKGSFAKGTRWCRGLDLSQGASEEHLARLDLESRFEACLRGRYDRTWHGTSANLERFCRGRRS